jgi:formylglycine-generating enzyme required for sulfatase activity
MFEDIPRRFSLPEVRRVFALMALAYAVWGGVPRAAKAARPVWVRLEVVENTAEGPAFDRCTAEGILKGRVAHRWRVFYGEVRADSGAGWEAMRPRSGCAAIASERSPNPWILRGSPYLLVDVALKPAATSEREVRLEASLTASRLTGFAKTGTPAYEVKTEKRTLRIPAGGSAVVPILAASRKEAEALGVRELLLRFRAAESGSGRRSEYGEIAVTADVPRASIFLEGGFVGHTSSGGPVVLRAVRTGDREVSARDPSGREARQVAHVVKGGRAAVSLTLLPKPAGPGPGGPLPLGRNAQGSEEFWREKDGAIMVRIPGGEFRMGSAEGEGEAAEHPQHAVRVQGFLTDKTEVTWGQYRRFATQTGRPLPKAPVWGMPEAFPASNVTWEDARAFCAWAGGRLPTEAEWERAARGGDARRYPWGNEWDPARCNTQEGGPHAPTASGSYPGCVSPYGVLDLAGSVWEWCQDWYDAGDYANSPVENPAGPETGHTRVSRGGCWINPSWWVRSANRQGIDPMWPDPTRGFRCVQDDREGTGK